MLLSDLPYGTAVASKLNTPLTTIDPNANHLRPQTSRTNVRNVSAGNSVTEAMVNVKNISNPNDPTFLTCPSKVKEIAIQITINNRVIFLKRGVLKRSKTE